MFQTPQTSSKSDQIGSSDELCSAWCVDRIEHFKSETLVFISVTFIILSQDVNTSVQTVNQPRVCGSPPPHPPSSAARTIHKQSAVLCWKWDLAISLIYRTTCCIKSLPAPDSPSAQALYIYNLTRAFSSGEQVVPRKPPHQGFRL